MTSAAEKANETRRRHREAQKVKYQETVEIREKPKKTCLTVLDDVNASPANRIRAAEILHDLIKRW